MGYTSTHVYLCGKEYVCMILERQWTLAMVK